MARRRKANKSKRLPSDPLHEEMLHHLDEHPPPDSKPAPGAPHPARSHHPPSGPPARSRLMLRKMPLELALSTLERFLQAKQHLGEEELVVIVGKGHGSPGGKPVLAPAVRRWLDEHPRLVAGYETAPAHEGGTGAILVRLRPV